MGVFFIIEPGKKYATRNRFTQTRRDQIMVICRPLVSAKRINQSRFYKLVTKYGNIFYLEVI